MDVANLVVRFSTSGVEGTTAQMGEVDSKISSVGSTATRVGGLMTVGLTLPLLALGAHAFTAASDTNEAINKVNVVFGQSSTVITQWATNAATQMGISNVAALNAAGTFGNLFINMGFTQQAASQMSTQVVQLASDLASFNNVSPDQALNALQSALVGENEPMRQFGVNLSDATVKAKAMEMGLYSGTGAISENARAQATLALVTQQTSAAQGDFARTSDGAANQMRIAKAEFADTAAVLGTQLYPIGTQILGMLTQMGQGFSQMSPRMQTVVTTAIAVVAVVGPLAVAIGFVASNATTFGAALGTVIAPLSAFMAMAVQVINLPLLATLIVWRTNIFGLRDAFVSVAGAVGDAAVKIASAGTTAIGGLASAVDSAVTSVLSVSMSGVVVAMITPFTSAGTWLTQSGTDAISGLSTSVTDATSAVLTPAVSGVVAAVLTPFAGAGSWLVNAGSAIIQGLIDGIQGMIPSLGDILGHIGDLIPNLKGPESKDRQLLVPAGGWIMGGLIRSIQDSIPNLRSTLTGITNDIGSLSASGTARLALAGSGAAAAASFVGPGGQGNSVIYDLRGAIIGADAERWINDRIQRGATKVIDNRVPAMIRAESR